MSDRADYYRKRRAKLRRAHLCTRCGLEPPEQGHALCSSCLGVMIIKKPARPVDTKRKRLLARLARVRESAKVLELELLATG